MDKSKAAGLFKAAPAEAKGDATTRVVRDIIAREIADRDAKTDRLRKLRLAKEAADAATAAAVPEKPKRAPAKRKAKVA
jgi:hypothetical protein